MPEAWEFDIAFDASNRPRDAGRGRRQLRNTTAYIKAQNHATDTSRAAVEKLIPLAEELKVVIGLENVWNNLWVKPALFAAFRRFVQEPVGEGLLRYRQSREVRAAAGFDPQALGPLIAKVHIKDFKLNPDGHGGNFVHPRDGSIDWPAVRRALDDAGYDGWATIEDGGLPLAGVQPPAQLI